MIETFMALSFGVWVLLAFLSVAVFAAARSESLFAGALLLIATAVAAFFIAGFNALVWVWQNPDTTIYSIALYVLTGIGWSIMSWSRVNKERARAWIEDGKKEARRNFYQPSLFQNKHRISCWIAYWPFSFLQYVMGDMLEKIINWIIEKLYKVYEAVGDRHFK